MIYSSNFFLLFFFLLFYKSRCSLSARNQVKDNIILLKKKTQILRLKSSVIEFKLNM